MSDRRVIGEAWGLLSLYPLAAFLVFLSLQAGSLPNYFERHWPYILGGPIGIAVWWLIANEWRSWPAIIGGYFAGALSSFLVVLLLRAITGRGRKTFD